ncbi:hypothetical protein Pla144_29650 [Bythopirellula polymerisocia]|uniref:Uncharacterized protein n=2 Tax=Bythopirellula polymerisocia TaxID=2528003 RepID=A0A5C6CLI4_9BACT|nr:hypothetical protein Pla144_29650 [Bythopirellula polymerisocia]
MIGGVFLGSTYLGIDMKDMTIAVLAKADVVSPDFFKSSSDPTQTQAELKSASTDSPSPETGTTSDIDMMNQLNESEQSDELGKRSGTLGTNKTPELTDAKRRAATRVYWDALTDCMLYEAKNRSQGFQADQEWQLYDYLTSRKQGHSQALETLKQLDEFGVDDRLIDHGRQVVIWNTSAVTLFERALALLTDGPSAGISGPFAQSWQSSATQLRMEESLILDKHNAVASYLDHEYPDIAPFAPAYKN